MKEAIKPTAKRWKKGLRSERNDGRLGPNGWDQAVGLRGERRKVLFFLREARVFGWRWKLLRLNEKKRHCADLHLSYETPFIHYYLHLITTSLTQLPSPFSSITLSEKSARRRRHWSIRAGKKKEWTVILLWTMPLSFFPRENTLYRLCLLARVIFPLYKKSNGDQDYWKCQSDFHLYGTKWDTKAHLTGFIVGV